MPATPADQTSQSTPASSTPMEADEHRKMAEVESRLWWYRALHRKILDTLLSLSLPESTPLLDAGCGTGGLLEVLSKAGFSNVSGFDISPTAAAICHERGFTIKTLGIQDTGRVYGANSFSAIISNDVLCYLTPQDIPGCLRNLHTLLRDEGYLLLNLPAYKAFSGIHDKSVGIVTRTSASVIRQQLTAAGFRIMELHHWPFLLAPIIFLTRLKQRIALRINQDCIIQSDIDLPSSVLNELLYTLTTAEQGLGSIQFFGSSIFVLACKK